MKISVKPNDILEFTRERLIFACAFALSSFLQAILTTIEGPSYKNLFKDGNKKVFNSSNAIQQSPSIDPLTGTASHVKFEQFKQPGDPINPFLETILTYYHVLSFILTPIIGGLIENIGLKKVYMFGVYIGGLTPFLSAVLWAVRKDSNYLIYSFFIRGLEAVSAVGMQVSVYMMITIVFPARVASIFALNQAMSSLGFVVGGPLVFYIEKTGGFQTHLTTLITLGIFYSLFAITIYFILPDLPPRPCLNIGLFKFIKRYIRILKIIPIVFYTLTLVITAMGGMYLQRILTHYIRNHDVGLFGATIVPLLPVLLQLLSPIWGYTLDKLHYANIVALIGAWIVTLSFIFIGPLPFIPIRGTLLATCFGLIIFGFGQGALIVSAYILIIQESEEHSIPDDMLTASDISAIYVAAISLGNAIGPYFSEIFYDAYGFKTSTIFPFACYACMLIFFIVDKFINPAHRISEEEVEEFKNAKESNTEYSPLIPQTK